jgi:hypothetical protein
MGASLSPHEHRLCFTGTSAETVAIGFARRSGHVHVKHKRPSGFVVSAPSPP